MNNQELDRSEFLIYQTNDGNTRIEVKLQDETVWLTQAQMAVLFQTTKQNVSLHIKNMFEEQELTPGATVKESLTVQNEGNRQISRKDFIHLITNAVRLKGWLLRRSI
jgi:hypothetical protein